MTESINSKLQRIFAEVLDIPADGYHPDLKKMEVEGWDSVGHISLVMSVEHAFGIKIPPHQAEGLTSPGAFAAFIQSSIGARSSLPPTISRERPTDTPPRT